MAGALRRLSGTSSGLVKNPAILTALIAALGHALLMAPLLRGDFFNAYPYQDEDSFDWITEGLALVQLITGHDTSPWPVLRSPVFVLLSALDASFGMRGIVFLLTQSLATGLPVFLLVRFTMRRGFSTPVALTVAGAWFCSILGFYTLWTFSDPLASALMTAGALTSVEALERVRHTPETPFISTFGTAMLLSLFAGLTQVYGLIPFLVIFGVYMFLDITERDRRSINPLPFVAVLTVVFFYLTLASAWKGGVPHEGTPAQFRLLRPTLNMAQFYAGLWTLCFAVFVPLLSAIAAVLVQRRRPLDRGSLALCATVAVFATLSFCYQFEEARFTFIYWALFLLACVSLADRVRTSGAAWIAPVLAASCLVSALSGLLILPGNTYGIPRLHGTRIALGRTWLFTVISAEPVDRFHLQTLCGGPYDFCPRADAGTQPTQYADVMFQEYKRRKAVAARANE